VGYECGLVKMLGYNIAMANSEKRDRISRIEALQELWQHSRRVGKLAVTLGGKFSLKKGELEVLERAAKLHDVGKLLMIRLVSGNGSLTAKEREKLRYHPALGVLLVGLWLGSTGREVVMQHHEQPNGLGYPRGLREDQIHPLAGILAVADHYDALASDRCYRKRFKLSKVIQMLEDEAALGILNPGVVEKAVKLWGNGVR